MVIRACKSDAAENPGPDFQVTNVTADLTTSPSRLNCKKSAAIKRGQTLIFAGVLCYYLWLWDTTTRQHF